MKKWRYIQSIKELMVGELYEMNVTDIRSLVPWFLLEDTSRSADRPPNGSYVVYLGEEPGRVASQPKYRFLSSEGKMYCVYNTDFIYGLKRTEL